MGEIGESGERRWRTLWRARRYRTGVLYERAVLYAPCVACHRHAALLLCARTAPQPCRAISGGGKRQARGISVTAYGGNMLPACACCMPRLRT
jgi:hypothetical protein